MAVLEAKAMQTFFEQRPYVCMAFLVDSSDKLRPYVVEAAPPTFRPHAYIFPELPQLSLLTKSPCVYTVVLHPTTPNEIPLFVEA